MDSSLVNAVINCPASSSSGLVDKSKEWQMEMLMEKLRCKAGQFKSFFESAKALRMSLLEKRYAVDSMERNQLYKCLDTIQQNIKVTSLQAMVERLESVSRQMGLKFMAGPSGLDWFISSDMFYLEVVFESNDTVKDVKIHHEGKVEQQSCEELVSCLTRRDFADFTAQLEGLASIYQLNAEKKVKCKAFSALQSLETDLATLSSLQSIIKEPFNLVHKSPVGVLHKRRGGHPMKLTYFVSPYDLLDPVYKVSKPLVVDNLDVGNSVTVCIEGSLSHKLQTSALITVNTGGKNLVPVYGPLTNQNSANLPACFVLKLSKPMPVCVQLVRKIEQVTEIECGDVSSAVPLLSLIVQHASLTSSGASDPVDNKGLFVVLPDQVHCYFMTENRQLDGIVVTSIPFTHPAHVPQILVYLRQQALLNTIITSCVRPNSGKQVDLEKVIMMEITPLSYQQVSISLEHPIEESMATAELDLTDITNVTCKMYNASQDNHATDYVTKVLQRSLSVPITMRALIRSWQHEVNQGHRPESNGILGGGGGGPSGPGSGSSGGGTGGGGSGSGNTNGGLSGGGSAEHELNIKPDPDMMQTDCSGSQMMTDSNADTSFNNLMTMNSDDQSQPSKTLNNSPLSSGAGITTNNIFNLLTTEEKSLNINASTCEDSPINFNCNEISNSSNKSCSDNCNNVENDNVKNDTENSPTVAVNDDDNQSNSSYSNVNNLAASNVENISDNCSNNNNNNSNSNTNSHPSRKRKWKETKEDGDDEDIDDDDCAIILETSCSNDSNTSVSNTNQTVTVAPTVAVPSSTAGSGSVINKDDRETTIGEPEPKIMKKLTSSSSSLTSLSSSSSSSSSTPTSSLHSPSSILLDLENKNLVPPSVSITPILAPSISPVVGADRRPGVEIIPLTNTTISSSITITPINSTKETISTSSSSGNSGHSTSNSSRKSSKNSDDKDRKRKRRKEESTVGMGPPSKQDPLLKPVSVSIKPADCGSPRPSSPSVMRTPVKSMKHSPSAVYSSPKSSPKHGTSSPGSGKPSMSALKSAVSSPKSDGCSSKSKLSSSKDSSRDKERKSSSGHQSPKLKSSSVKLKQLDLNSSEYITSSASSGVNQSGGSTPPSGSSGDSKSLIQARNRKGSLSAVIDKLKSAQHCSDSVGGPACGDSNTGGKSSAPNSGTGCGNKDRNISSMPKSGDKTNVTLKQPGDSKIPGEYMVKHSSEMKITINKTRSKDSSKSSSSKSSGVVVGSSSSSSGSGSPKTHTGLKPGVNSGPASKKPLQTVPKTSVSVNRTSSKISKNISSNSINRSMKSSLTSKDSKQRSVKSSSSPSTSIFSKNDSKKLSPSAHRDKEEGKSDSSLSLAAILPAQLVVEGLGKPFDPNFQIPKLSARTSNNNNNNNNNAIDNDLKKVSDNNIRGIPTATDLSMNKQNFENKNFSNKILDESRTDSKISMSIDNRNDPIACDIPLSKKDEIIIEPVPDNMRNIGVNNNNNNNNITSIAGVGSITNNSNVISNSSTGSSANNIIPGGGPIGLTGKVLPNAINSILESSIDLKKISSGITTSQEAAEILLDISASLPINKVNAADKHLVTALPLRKNTPPPPPPPPPPPLPPLPLPVFPASPSVQVHIVKSPAPSPMIIPSPHSASPCITDDELMDEALVGID